MAQYTTVLANEFNTIRNTVATVLGTGSSTRGYGSPVTSAEVAVGEKIKPAEYTALATDINACYNHIAGSNASLNSVVQGGKITWANIVTYQVAATYIDTNRDSSSNNISTLTTQNQILFDDGWGSGDGGLTVNYEVEATGTITFSSADAMRHFFNQDGYLRIDGSTSMPDFAMPKTFAFVNLCNEIDISMTKSNYRAGTGASQTAITTVAPYSGGTPSQIQASFYLATDTQITWAIICTDNGNEDGDGDGDTEKSTIDTRLNFYVNAVGRNIGGSTGIVDYRPTIITSDITELKIICTELYRQGKLPEDIYQADQQFGQSLVDNNPDTYYGYLAWAEVGVEWMQGRGPDMLFWVKDPVERQQRITAFVNNWAEIIAVPWAEHMAYRMGVREQDNKVGKLLMCVGIPICVVVGKWQRWFGKSTKPTGWFKGAAIISICAVLRTVVAIGNLLRKK